MSKEIELKPCPICMGKAELHEGDKDIFDYILCQECGLYMDAENFDSTDELIKNWNQRSLAYIDLDEEQINKLKQNLEEIAAPIIDFLEKICDLLLKLHDQIENCFIGKEQK